MADRTTRPLLSVSAAAEVAGVSRSTMYGLLAAGAIPGVLRVDGHETLIRRAALLAWLDGEDARTPAGAA